MLSCAPSSQHGGPGEENPTLSQFSLLGLPVWNAGTSLEARLSFWMLFLMKAWAVIEKVTVCSHHSPGGDA